MGSIPSVLLLIAIASGVVYGTYLGMRLTRNAARLHHWLAQRSELDRLGLRPSLRPRNLAAALVLGTRWLEAPVFGARVGVGFRGHNDQVRIKVGGPGVRSGLARPQVPLAHGDETRLAELLPPEVLSETALTQGLTYAHGRRQAAKVAQRTTELVLVMLLRLRTLPTLALRLADLALDEAPIPVRVLALQLLAQVDPDASRETSRELLDHADLGLRQAAALGLGEEGLDVLLALGLYEGQSESTWKACLAAALQGEGATARAGQALGDTTGPRKAFVLQTLTPSPDGRSLYLTHLSDPHPGARLAAAQGLAHCGLLADVEPLLAARTRHTLDRPFARAADQAIGRIQHGLGGQAAGGLAIAEPGAVGGELTVSEQLDGGQLEICREPEER